MLRKYGGGRAVSTNRNCHVRAHQPELTIAWDGIPMQSVRICPWASSFVVPSMLLWLSYSRACFLGHSFEVDDLFPTSLFLLPVSCYPVFTHTSYSALNTDKHTISQRLDVPQD